VEHSGGHCGLRMEAGKGGSEGVRWVEAGKKKNEIEGVRTRGFRKRRSEIYLPPPVKHDSVS